MKMYRITIVVTTNEGEQETHYIDFPASELRHAFDFYNNVLKEASRQVYSVLKCSLKRIY